MLHNPPERTLDILFVHGLGGSSLRTWCHGRDLDNLWPKLWLTEELPTARILTFGYNAAFSSREEKTTCTIGDFATDLLFRMKHGESSQAPERLGQVPIVVVAHSMGGLVFKKAFVQGQSSAEFADVVSMIKAVVFLATPHRGSDLAETLNRVLSSSVFGHSPKQYVAELARGSPTIDELNDSFRHHAAKLQLFSFYETLATAMGPVSAMVVEKPSAVMGYPSETPAPLTANHHDVCKFASKQDPNYASVAGALRSIAEVLASPPVVDEASEEDLEHLTKMLGVTGAPEEDLDAGRAARNEGTCEGFLASKEANTWRHATSPGILWVHAGPGCGKSTVSSFVIEQLLETGHCCAYFYFKFGQRDKQSAASMILSIAYQMALQVPEFRRQLVEIAKAGTKLSGMDAAIAWDKLFSRTLARVRGDRVVYWVLDGLDEADSSRRVVDILARVGSFRWPVRVLVLGRPLPNIKREFDLARKKVQVVDMPLPGTQHDIERMVTEELNALISSDGFKAEVVSTIATRAQGSFLWASLVTQRVVQCHRHDQVRRVLKSTPDGMQRLYDRMTDAVLGLELDEDKELARLLLTWAMYAVTPVTVDELVEAYPAEFSSIMDVNHTITLVCGQFVTLNSQGCVTLVHHSAREHLQQAEHAPFSFDPEQANEELLEKCLAALGAMAPGDSCADSDVSRHVFYAAVSWPLHLERSAPGSDRVLDALVRFFRAPCSLVWIQILAARGRLSDLLDASRRLAAYLSQRGRAKCLGSPETPQRTADLSLLKLWTVDLTKLPAKFARYLSERPSVIYEYIPALSPRLSAIHQLFNENSACRLSVSGLSTGRWDDRVARVLKGARKLSQMAVSRGYLAVACSEQQDPTVTLWDTTLFAEKKAFILDGVADALAFNHAETLLAACTATKTWVWRVADWSVHAQIEHPWQFSVVEFKFNESDDLMAIERSGGLHKLPAESPEKWEKQASHLPVPRPGKKVTPVLVALNKNCTLVAVNSDPGHVDFDIWTVDPPRRIASFNPRIKKGEAFPHRFPMSPIAWHPSNTAVICNFGRVFKWTFLDNSYDEVKGRIDVDWVESWFPHAACSPDGQLFAVWEWMAAGEIYDFSSMTLIYRLNLSSNLCFDPAGHRLYASNLDSCDIWEPGVLQSLPLADKESGQEQAGPHTSLGGTRNDSAFPAAEDPPVARPQLIVDLAPAQTTRGLLVAELRVTQLSIYDSKTQTTFDASEFLHEIIEPSFAWGPEHDCFAFTGYDQSLIMVSLRLPQEDNDFGPITGGILLDYKPSGSRLTRQLLVNASGNRLLRVGSDAVQVFSVPSGVVLAESTSFPDYTAWLQHPSKPEHLAVFSVGSVAIMSWDSLEEMTRVPLSYYGRAICYCRGAVGAEVGLDHVDFDDILDSHSPTYILLRSRICCYRHMFALFSTADIFGRDKSVPPADLPASHSASGDGPGKTARLDLLFREYTACAIGILPNNRLVFVEPSLWVSSIYIPDLLSLGPEGWDNFLATGKTKRHFFLPPEQVTHGQISRCRLLNDGTVLYPVGGEVAMMKGDLMSNEVEEIVNTGCE